MKISIKLSGLALLFVVLLSACAHASNQTGRSQTTTEQIEVAGVPRTFIVHMPPQASNGTEKMPVVFMFHGGGGRADVAMKDTGWDRLADREGFIAVFPNGTREDMNREASFTDNQQTWNDGSPRISSLGAIQRNSADIQFVRSMIEWLVQNKNADPNRIYATGFSNGASMSARIAHELNDMVAAVAVVSGADWNGWQDGYTGNRAMPIMFMTGDSDPLNPLAGGRFLSGQNSMGANRLFNSRSING